MSKSSPTHGDVALAGCIEQDLSIVSGSTLAVALSIPQFHSCSPSAAATCMNLFSDRYPQPSPTDQYLVMERLPCKSGNSPRDLGSSLDALIIDREALASLFMCLYRMLGDLGWINTPTRCHIVFKYCTLI
jgi:hypothetical protein